MNAAHCISGKTNEMYNLLLGELTPRNKLVAGTLEILADGTANLDRWRNNSQGKPRALNQWREHKKESREYNKQQHKQHRSTTLCGNQPPVGSSFYIFSLFVIMISLSIIS
jgi:hypothetical protein